jgi:hypothetical protein
MKASRGWRAVVFGDLGVLILLAAVRCLPLILTNGQSGWHRDELDTGANARALDWGYVSYPPVARRSLRASRSPCSGRPWLACGCFPPWRRRSQWC